MRYSLSVDVYCAVGVDDLGGTVTLADGTRHDVTLAGGALEATYDARPVSLAIGAATAAARRPPSERERPRDAVATHADAVFGRPLDIPESGRLALDIVWDCDCHGELHVRDPDGRFGSYEHIQCAYWVGYDKIDGQLLAAPVEITYETPLDLVAGRTLTYGEIICLAGDFFAHLDGETAAQFADAWPPLDGMPRLLAGSDYRKATLADASREAIDALLDAIHGEGTGSTTALDNLRAYPNHRYYALASQNFCHFGSPGPGVTNEALALYLRYHDLARKRAAAAGDDENAWMRAVVTEAFGCHFLTDLFATGHMRTPRRALGERFGILRGALWMSKRMHDEDNHVGLWCTTSDPAIKGKRVVWRAFGDGRLMDSPVHLRQVQEAVRRSLWEIYEAREKRSVSVEQRAESLIPKPLAPWTAPSPADVLPNGDPHPADQPLNHAAMYVLLPNGHIGQREGGLDGAAYRDLEA